jgi:hypothetical protein
VGRFASVIYTYLELPCAIKKVAVFRIQIKQENMSYKKIKDTAIYFLIVGIVIFIWVAVSIWIDQNISAGDIGNQALTAAKGQFGDKFGAVNALFSGLAFSGIIITLLLQKRDLAETRSAMGHERFDNTFFQLLNLHIDIATRLKTPARVGTEAFEAFSETIKRGDEDFYAYAALQKISRDKVRKIIDSKIISAQLYPEFNIADITNLETSLLKGVGAFENFLDNDIEMHEKKIVHAYKRACLEYIDYFSHYFRNLYHLFKFIDESELIEESDKRMYSKYVRSQLSDVELVCLFYNSISKIALPGRENMELGYPKMQAYLKKFDVLQNMNPRSLIHPIHLEIFEKNRGK